MSRSRIAVLLVIGCLVLPAVAAAQSSTGLRSQMQSLMAQNIVIARVGGSGPGIIVHDAVFSSADTRITEVTDLVDQISRQIGLQVANFPLGSSSGGFTYTYDSSVGGFTRSSETFGPAFAERALTAGRGKASFGLNYVHSKYSSLDGYDLQDGSISFFLDHQAMPVGAANQFVEGDEIQAQLNLQLKSDTFAFLSNFGVTDRLDIGVAVPFVRNSMELAYNATILDFSTAVSSPSTHLFPNGTKKQTFSSSGSASGLGDVVVRAKYNLSSRGATGLAAAVDLTLPSGNEDDMLGTGAAQAKFYLIGSGAAGTRLFPHVNVGFTAAGNDIGGQFNYVGGIEFLASPRATIVGDFVGRTYLDTLRLSPAAIAHQYRTGNSSPLQTVTLNSVTLASGHLNSMLGTIGVKLNLANSFLLSAHIVAPMSDSGLRSSVTPVIGIDYTF